MSDPTKVLYDRVVDRVIAKLREAVERDGLDPKVVDDVREVTCFALPSLLTISLTCFCHSAGTRT